MALTSSWIFFLASSSRFIRFSLRGFRHLFFYVSCCHHGQSPSLCGRRRQYGGGPAGNARVGDDDRCALPGFQHQGSRGRRERPVLRKRSAEEEDAEEVACSLFEMLQMDWRSPPCFRSGSCISYLGVCGFAPRTSRTTAFRSSGQLAVGVVMPTRPRGRSKGRVPGPPAAKQLRPGRRSPASSSRSRRGTSHGPSGPRRPAPGSLRSRPPHPWRGSSL